MQKDINTSDLILTADWHIRSDVPENRKDDFLHAQEKKIDFILAQSDKYQASILVAGDLGDKSKWENWLLEKYIKKFKAHSQKIYVLPGQHDLPNHRLDKLSESGLGVLVAAKAIEELKILWPKNIGEISTMYNFPFGHHIKMPSSFAPTHRKNIAIVHQLIVQSKLWASQENFIYAESLLKKFPCYDLIVSGDNHQSFVEKYKDRILVNPGSIMRSTVAQYDHQPKIYLWCAEGNSVEEIEIPIVLSKDVFDLSRSEEIKKKDERMFAFIDSLRMDGEIKMSFKKNLEWFFRKNRVDQQVKDKIFMSLEKGK